MYLESDGRKPSTVTDVYWLHAFRQTAGYPESTNRSGKWLIFVPLSRVDGFWQRIKTATQEGRLGDEAKVATAKSNPNATDHSRKVICVYTYDWKDKEDVMRIREQLRKLGVHWKIPYKADEDTDAGKYSKRGHLRISKYFE